MDSNTMNPEQSAPKEAVHIFFNTHVGYQPT